MNIASVKTNCLWIFLTACLMLMTACVGGNDRQPTPVIKSEQAEHMAFGREQFKINYHQIKQTARSRVIRVSYDKAWEGVAFIFLQTGVIAYSSKSEGVMLVHYETVSGNPNEKDESRTGRNTHNRRRGLFRRAEPSPPKAAQSLKLLQIVMLEPTGKRQRVRVYHTFLQRNPDGSVYPGGLEKRKAAAMSEIWLRQLEAETLAKRKWRYLFKAGK